MLTFGRLFFEEFASCFKLFVSRFNLIFMFFLRCNEILENDVDATQQQVLMGAATYIFGGGGELINIGKRKKQKKINVNDGFAYFKLLHTKN